MVRVLALVKDKAARIEPAARPPEEQAAKEKNKVPMDFAAAVNESVLIEDVKCGKRSSFDILVSFYQQRGLGIAYNLARNLEDAKDILQEAFIKIYLNIKGFRGGSRFSTWFYRIVVNCALDFLRKRKRAGRIFVEISDDQEGKKTGLEIPDLSFEPRRAGMAKEFAKELEECIARLSKMQKLCFVLKHQNSLSIQEISETLKCNPATVKVHLFRAVGNLRKYLTPYLKAEGGLRC